FFFQAEDGIRDFHVTGVQTCALPIFFVARNKKALHEYDILDSWEAGIVLTGPEVKSVRAGRVNMAGAFARVENGEVWVYGMHIRSEESRVGKECSAHRQAKEPKKTHQ